MNQYWHLRQHQTPDASLIHLAFHPIHSRLNTKQMRPALWIRFNSCGSIVLNMSNFTYILWAYYYWCKVLLSPTLSMFALSFLLWLSPILPNPYTAWQHWSQSVSCWCWWFRGWWLTVSTESEPQPFINSAPPVGLAWAGALRAEIAPEPTIYSKDVRIHISSNVEISKFWKFINWLLS